MTEDIPEFTINEIQEMIDANFGDDVPRLIKIRDELKQTSHLGVEDTNFLKITTKKWDRA